ncbi:hypothetical protein I302_103762 [Kwoniella bestiolae CBS 10118]|uniref:Uncharacterized protein n=1 Tax=Kwoniella bestiolae CBS 10118 TaxID=1296100 RepID=A0A1B9G9D6_9TREE|nr:hypothetical protein I302_02466 [Kwoniella bestiolae CBS 10118]OCF27623.1 hypothetical protein I302_02466 [Kwoniella bestiolae CBS 10118]
MEIFKYYGTFQDDEKKSSTPVSAFLGPFAQVSYKRPTGMIFHSRRLDGTEEINPRALQADRVDLAYPLDLMIPEPGSLDPATQTIVFSRPMCETAIPYLNSTLTRRSDLNDFELSANAANWQSLENHVNSRLRLAAHDCGRYLTDGARPPAQISDASTAGFQLSEGPTLIRKLTVGERTLQVHKILGPSFTIQSSRGDDVDVNIYWLPIRTLQGSGASLNSAAHPSEAVSSILENRCSATRCETGSAGEMSSPFVC